MQRNFEPMRKQVEGVAYRRVDDSHGARDHLRGVHRERTGGTQAPCPARAWRLLPQSEEFKPRTVWSLSNAFGSAFKELEPIPQFRTTVKLAGFRGATRPG
jgi:hypothetical protein